MDLFLILIIVAIVLAVIVKVAFWLFVGWFAVRAVNDYAQQMDSEMAQFQHQLQQAGAPDANALAAALLQLLTANQAAAGQAA